MGTITTGVGLISGIDTGALIDSIITLESQGKFNLQERLANLQAQQTALLDINARLLNFRGAVDAFRVDSIFRAALATSNNEDLLTASAASATTPGSYTFIVNNLVSNSQKLSQGYATRDASPLGLDSIGFEFGKGLLAPVSSLEVLNGGTGVSRGRIVVTDRDGGQATVDLTDVTSLDEVVDRINAATGANVTALATGDGLTITDNTGGVGTLSVADAQGFTTATDLGIAAIDGGAGDVDVTVDGVITGGAINRIGANTPLSTLNDGNGVLIINNVADFQIRARDLTLFDVDLGRINAPITDATLLEDLNDGAGVTLNGDSDDPDIFISAKSNDPSFDYNIDLTGVTTVAELKARILTGTAGNVNLTIEDGKRFLLTDTTGGGGVFQVKGAGVNGTDTANDLGILEEAGEPTNVITGTDIANLASQSRALTIQDVLDRINDATDNQDGGLPEGRKVTASVAPDGVSLFLTDHTGGGSGMRVLSTVTNAFAASDLGIEVANVAAPTYDGARIVSSLNSVMVGNLNGGLGLSGNDTVDLTDRAGVTVSVGGLDAFVSLNEIIDALNTAATGAGVQITAGLNATGNGLKFTDTSGGAGNVIVTGNAAASLGVDTGVLGVAQTEVAGTSLQHRYISESTALSELNYGRGVATGGIRIIDGFGTEVEISIGNDAVTVHDVIAEINALASAKGVKVQARINDNGDGLQIESTYLPADTPFIPIRVEAAGGTTARDLNILGESATIDDAIIDGSYEVSVDLTVTDTLEDVVQKITDARIPVAATVLNTGSPASPFRLSLTSEIGGVRGELLVDTGAVDLGLSTLSRGVDAKIFFGADNPEDAFLITSNSNTVTDVIPGLTLDLVKASSEAVTIEIARDVDTVVETVNQFATTFNDVIGRIDQFDFFDVDTETRGVLLGNPTVSRIRNLLFTNFSRPVEGVDTQFRMLNEIGFSVGRDGQINFDETEFREAYENDRVGVENLFLALKADTQTTRVVVTGVSVNESTTTSTVRGVVAIFDDLMERILDPISGIMTNEDQSFNDRIDQFNDRIELLDERLAARRARLQKEFTGMELALAQLQGQAGALSSLFAGF